MAWQQIFSGVLLVVRSELAIINFHHLGLSPVQTFLIASIWTNLTIVVLFYFTGFFDWLTLKVKKKRLSEIFVRLAWVRRLGDSLKNGQKRVLNWLLEHNKLIIFLVLFTPFTPFLEDIAVVAAKIARIKYAFPLLLIANTARMALVTFFVYFVF
ncbi:hypothetical protein ISS21_02405 [Patescibacteria group bacterium]|nr:hypothetical protein [Patescibacteria group bacterium]